MTKWTKIEFSDIREGDTIKTVNEVGTIRIGTVTHFSPGFYSDGEWFDGFACEAKGQLLAMVDDNAYYRRTPKFVPLDVPKVGQWIEAKFRNGDTETFQVTKIVPCGDFLDLEGRTPDDNAFINLKKGYRPTGQDLLSWTPVDPPVPAEPTGLGAVVEEPNGDTWTRTDQVTLPWFLTRTKGNAGRWSWGKWLDVEQPVTVLSEGVTR